MNLNLMKHNKKVWIQTIILTGGFVLFLGYVLIGVNIKNLDIQVTDTLERQED